MINLNTWLVLDDKRVEKERREKEKREKKIKFNYLDEFFHFNQMDRIYLYYYYYMKTLTMIESRKDIEYMKEIRDVEEIRDKKLIKSIESIKIEKAY